MLLSHYSRQVGIMLTTRLCHYLLYYVYIRRQIRFSCIFPSPPVARYPTGFYVEIIEKSSNLCFILHIFTQFYGSGINERTYCCVWKQVINHYFSVYFVTTTSINCFVASAFYVGISYTCIMILQSLLSFWWGFDTGIQLLADIQVVHKAIYWGEYRQGVVIEFIIVGSIIHGR